MPEFAEVAFFCRRWAAGRGDRIAAVLTHKRAKVFRRSDAAAIKRKLTGAKLLQAETAAKQMLFRFSGGGLSRTESRGWLGIHLGMSGELRVEPPDYLPQKHDHLVLVQKKRTLVFNDPRMFGEVQFSTGSKPPTWWTKIAPPILSADFSIEAVEAFLRRRGRAPIKAVLLMQQRFPGVGNWMADEILWRAAIHPKRLSGSLSPAETRALHRECRNVCQLALEKIAGVGGKLPPDLNVNIPQGWLFWHRWESGGKCPRTGVKLLRESVGGRTTCWSPARQKLK